MERRTKSYLQLIKPGITLSNTLTAVAGFLLAKSSHGFSLSSFLGLTFGVSLIVASACVVNNIIDRSIDVRMGRTKGRAIASGEIDVQKATIYAIVLGVGGFTLLAALTNWPAFAFGIIAYLWYVSIYGYAKRTSPLSTIIGGVCGALPPVAGYVTVTGSIDIVVLILFTLMMIWQLPHFYAISIFREKDYARAQLPIWSVKYGLKSTQAQIFFWVIIFTILLPLLTLVHATGITYLVIMGALGLYWIFQGVRYYAAEAPERWSKRMFGVSLVVLLAFIGTVASGRYLP